MEARRNAQKIMSGDAIAFALNPNHPFREGQYRGAPQSAAKAKDHARQNRDLIKALARKAKERAATQVERQAQPAFKMKKFATIDSKLAKEVPAAPGRFQNFLRKGSGVIRYHPVGEKSPRDDTDSTISSQEADSVNEISAQIEGMAIGDSASPRKAKNFLKANVNAVLKAHPPAQKAAEAAPISTTIGFGRIPLYIHKRKLELAQKEEEKRLEKEKERLPPGMTLMSEEERQRTIQLLLDNQKKLVGELAKMPLTIETPSLVEKHNQIQAKIAEVEKALKLFNRKKVYVTS